MTNQIHKAPSFAAQAETAALRATDSAKEAEESAKVATDAMAKSDTPAENLVTATVGGLTSLLALFVGVGLTADRLAVAFNGGAAQVWLVLSLITAVAAIIFGLLAVVVQSRKRLMAVLAVIALGSSLALGVVTASQSFSDGGRPTLTNVSVTAEGDTHATLKFTVTASGVQTQNLLRAFASWVPTAKGASAPKLPFYVSTLRPDDKGLVNQEVVILIARPPQAQFVRVQVYWDTAASKPPQSRTSGTAGSSTPTPTQTSAPITPPAAVGALCSNQADAAVAAACVDVEVAASVVTPIVAPSTTN